MREGQDRDLARTEELSGFEVAEGDPGVRGWEVIGRDGRRIGEAGDLLVDPEDRQVRYLEVRLANDSSPLTGTLGGLERAAIPELDPQAGPGEISGQASVPGVTRPEAPARTVGEALVRDSLLDIENRLTAGEHPVSWKRGGHPTLVPFERVHLDPATRQVRLE